MSRYLIDTNVLFEYNRPSGPDPGVKKWLESTDIRSQYVSVITLAEISKGIQLLEPSKRRSQLELWLKQDLEQWFSGRVLSFDNGVGERWAGLVSTCIRIGRPIPTLDSFLAATAIEHNLTIVTRNTKDFADLGLTILNPWT